ncbi:MAG: hypothetical protein WCD72_08370 [Dehalococcoidia bacterium]
MKCNDRLWEAKVPELLVGQLRVHPETSHFGEGNQKEGVVERSEGQARSYRGCPFLCQLI